MPEDEVQNIWTKAIRKMKRFVSHPYFLFSSKKFFFYLIVIIIALSLAFALPRMMPGDPIKRVIHFRPTNPAQIPGYLAKVEQMREDYGLNKTYLEQYIEFWGDMLRFDLGHSFKFHPSTVMELIIPRLWLTLILILPVLFFSFFIGNWIGARAAFMQVSSNKFGSLVSQTIYYLAILAQSAPFYWVAILFYVFLVSELDLFPIFGSSSAGIITPRLDLVYIADFLHHYTLPFLTLLITYSGGWATGMRAMVLYEMDSEYMLYAEQLGFRDKTLRKYAQRNSILPQLTGINLRFIELISSTLIIEVVFGWQGIGYLGLNSVLNMDYPLMMGTFIVTLVIIVVGNFIMDIGYGFIDPRIRTGFGD